MIISISERNTFAKDINVRMNIWLSHFWRRIWKIFAEHIWRKKIKRTNYLKQIFLKILYSCSFTFNAVVKFTIGSWMDGTPPRKISRTNFGPYLEMKSRKSLCLIKRVCLWVREREGYSLSVCVYVCMCVCVRVCLRKCVCVSVRVCMCVWNEMGVSFNIQMWHHFFRLHLKFSLSCIFFKEEEKNILFPFINFVDWNFSPSLPLCRSPSPSLSPSLCLSPFKLIKELTLTFLFKNILVIVSSLLLSFCSEDSSIQMNSIQSLREVRRRFDSS